MTAAYASIANKGVYTEPILYTKILDHEGNLLYEKTPETHVALKETTAALLTNAMQDVIRGSEGTGRTAALPNMPVSGKTGTTQNSGDLWLSAFTPYLTCSVWTGYDDLKPMEGLNQSFHMKIWKNIMQRIHADYEYKEFSMPNSIEQKTICTESGNLASSDACSKLTEYFAPGTAPTQSCPGHIVEEPEEPEETTPSDETPSDTSRPPSVENPGQGNNSDNNGSDSNSGSDNGNVPVPPEPSLPQ